MKTKDIRNSLCKALKKAENGELPADEAKTIIGLANQISQSLATEVKVISLKLRMGAQADAIGQLNVTE
jgi:hypothetical protein